MTRQPAVYILSNKKNGTLYIGVTSNLQKRVWEHKNNMVEGFTERYGIHRLVYYELREHDVSHTKRETDEEMELGVEARTDRDEESTLE